VRISHAVESTPIPLVQSSPISGHAQHFDEARQISLGDAQMVSAALTALLESDSLDTVRNLLRKGVFAAAWSPWVV
jgi:hypothetical protein